jgi:hypothetical protein
MTFGDGFVDFKVFPGNSVPYLAPLIFDRCYQPLIQFHQIWFTKKTPIQCTVPQNETCNESEFLCPTCCNEKQNYFHVVGGSEATNYAGTSKRNSDMSYVLVDSIQSEVNVYCNAPPQQACSGTEVPNYTKQTTNHELAHQFGVNQDCGGEDLNLAWCGNSGGSCISPLPDCGPQEWCIMNALGGIQGLCQRIDGIDKMDCNDLAGIMCDGVQFDCAGEPPLSVRTDLDPE